MKFIDFFAGIGGFRRGMELAGHKCVGFCEWDKYATMSYISMHLITEQQRKYLATLPLKQRQKEILKNEYRNGEWYSNDIRNVHAGDMPKADCWCAGFPCQDISVAGKQLGFDGNRSSLYFQIIRLAEELKEEDRPEWIFLENVKNLLSVNNGWDFARVLFALDEVGYDIEWGVLNSKDFYVPQNRERVFIIGHLRGRGRQEVFPVEGASGKNSLCILGKTNPNRHSTADVYDKNGIMSTICGRDFKQPKQISIPVLTPDRAEKRQNGRRFKENGEPSFTLTGQDRHGVAVNVEPFAYDEQNQYEREDGTVGTLTTDGSTPKHNNRVCVPLDVEKVEEHPGIFVQLPYGPIVYAVWYEKYQCYIAIRKLTPKECFRLQGWTDDYFEKAAFVNSNSQLYKQAGNGVTVTVIHAVGEKMGVS